MPRPRHSEDRENPVASCPPQARDKASYPLKQDLWKGLGAAVGTGPLGAAADVAVGSFATEASGPSADQCPLCPQKRPSEKCYGLMLELKWKDRLAAVSPKSDQVF